MEIFDPPNPSFMYKEIDERGGNLIRFLFEYKENPFIKSTVQIENLYNISAFLRPSLDQMWAGIA